MLLCWSIVLILILIAEYIFTIIDDRRIELDIVVHYWKQ